VLIAGAPIEGACPSGVCYVDQAAPNCCSGTCCPSATCDGTAGAPFCTIWEAIAVTDTDAVPPIDTVWVRPGTYREDLSFGYHVLELRAASGTGSVTIEGYVAINGNQGAETLIDGFTINAGPTINRPGIQCSGTHPIIRNNVISGHTQEGVRLSGASRATLEGNVIGPNNMWGGVTIASSAPFILGCTIVGNQSRPDRGGGGIYIESPIPSDSEVIISNTVIEENSTTLAGGGIGTGALVSGAIRLSNVIVRDNTSVWEGGGAFFLGSFSAAAGAATLDVQIQNSLFSCNQSDYEGGGLDCDDQADCRLVNSTVVNNTAVRGGGVFAQGSVVEFDNSIIWGNSAPNGGPQGAAGNDSTLIARWSIVQNGCSGANPGFEVVGTSGNPTVDCCSGCNPPNVFSHDPLFVDALGPDETACTGDEDFHIAAASPAIDAANNLLALADFADLDQDADESERTPRDLDMNDRFADDPATVDTGVNDPPGHPYVVDMGAYEVSSCPAATIVDADPPPGTHDARRPHAASSPSFDLREGIGSPNSVDGGPEPITITLSSAVSGAANIACWSLCETGIEPTEGPALSDNAIKSVTETSPGVFAILLDRPISAGHWTSISYVGGVGSVSYASLPADANDDGVSVAADILDYFTVCPPSSTNLYRCDIDHSGVVGTPDILELIDLLNGASWHYPWNNVSRAPDTCGG